MGRIDTNIVLALNTPYCARTSSDRADKQTWISVGCHSGRHQTEPRIHSKRSDTQCSRCLKCARFHAVILVQNAFCSLRLPVSSSLSDLASSQLTVAGRAWVIQFCPASRAYASGTPGVPHIMCLHLLAVVRCRWKPRSGTIATGTASKCLACHVLSDTSFAAEGSPGVPCRKSPSKSPRRRPLDMHTEDGDHERNT